MKCFIVVVLLCVVAATKANSLKEEAMEALKSVLNECAAETGATEADMNVMMKHLPAENMETKCLRACVMKKIEVMNTDGKFDKAKALKMAESHTHGDPEKMKIAEAISSACGSIDVPGDHCEAAEMYKMCMQSEALKQGVNIMD